MKSICGADCDNCGYGKAVNCKGCVETKGCPFGRQCFIARYIGLSSKENFDIYVKETAEEFNSLNIPGMPEIETLFPLNGSFVNIEYPLPNGNSVKLLDDNEIYLGNQVECEFSAEEGTRCYGLVANMNFLLVAEYGENCADPEIIIYKKR